MLMDEKKLDKLNSLLKPYGAKMTLGFCHNCKAINCSSHTAEICSLLDKITLSDSNPVMFIKEDPSNRALLLRDIRNILCVLDCHE